jgi:radical SAM superfamily enzyme with C-terminal helix-hairpin-helix motif
MASHRQQVEDYIHNDLPQSFVASEISEMYTDLQKDIELIKTRSPSVDQKHMEMMLHHRHKKLAFSYPGLFFKIVRGEVDPNMLKSLLTLKQNLDENSISLEVARNRVIDSAKHQIEETKDKPRVKKAKPPGTVVQELKFHCKPDDL